MKIHISPHCRDHLTKLGGYLIEERGYVKLKGKGEILTYWLVGHIDGIQARRDVSGSQNEYSSQPTGLFAELTWERNKKKRKFDQSTINDDKFI